MIKIILFFSTTFFGLLVFAIFLAKRPSLSAAQFPASGILTFEQNPPPTLLPQHLRVVTYNIGYASGDKNNLGDILKKEEIEKNLQAMSEKLMALKPDIIALQEVDFNAQRSFHINELSVLARALHMPYAAYAVTWNLRYLPWPYWPPKLHFGAIVSGQAVLSRYPIRAQTLYTFAKPASNPFWYNWFYLNRILQKLVIDIGGKDVNVWNVHLDAFDPKARAAEADYLAKQINDDRAGYKLVLGDFNSASQTSDHISTADLTRLNEGGEALDTVLTTTGLQNAEGSEPFYTIPSWNPQRKIDHILYNASFIREKVGTVPHLTASDHLPVWAEFRLLVK